MYGYVGGNPVLRIDPFGLGVTDWGGPSTGGGTRGLLDGARYGYWSGKNWSGGPNGDKAPIDSSDACYMKHDKCYSACKDSPNKACIRACDGNLLGDLGNLPANPKEWPVPPPPGMEGAANKMRSAAETYFK
jgi:hypothetical protein